MSGTSPRSISSTKVEAPKSSTGSMTRSTTPLVTAPSQGSLILSNHGTSASMLLQWVYDTRNVPVNERLHQAAFHVGSNNGGNN